MELIIENRLDRRNNAKSFANLKKSAAEPASISALRNGTNRSFSTGHIRTTKHRLVQHLSIRKNIW